MTEPELTTIGGWVYDSLRPIAEPYDSQRGYPLAIYADALGGMLQPLLDVVDDPTKLLDPDLTPAGWLAWLGQFVGADIDGTRGRVADVTNLVPHPSFEDGTVGAGFDQSAALAHNYVTNPSFEVDVTGWTLGTGDTLTRSTAEAAAEAGGVASGIVATNGSTAGEGPSQVVTVPASTTYTFSVWAKGVAGGEQIKLLLEEQTSVGAVVGDSFSPTVTLDANSWVRVSVTRTFGSTGVKALISAITASGSPVAMSFKLDGLMLTESTSAPSLYADGDRPGWVWDGTAGKSASHAVASVTATQDWSRYGSWSVRYLSTRFDGTTVVAGRTPIGTAGIPVSPSDWIGARVSARLRINIPSNYLIKGRIYWYKSDGTPSATTTTDSTKTTAVADQAYDFVVGPVQPPSDAAYASVSFIISGPSPQVPYYIDADIDGYALFKLKNGTDPVPAYGDGTLPGWIWNGAAYNSTSSLIRDENDDELRTRLKPLIKDPPQRRRGTVPAVLDTVRAMITPGSQVFYVERVGGNWKVGSIAILTGTRNAGVTLQNIQSAVNAVKPAGSQITVSEITGGNWQSVRDTHTDWLDVRSTFVDWAEVRSNPTKQ